jgi:hypothetical protein
MATRTPSSGIFSGSVATGNALGASSVFTFCAGCWAERASEEKIKQVRVMINERISQSSMGAAGWEVEF